MYVSSADLDGDWDLDLAVANWGDNVSIMINLTQLPANQPPNPFSLISPIDGDSVPVSLILDWQNPYDPNFGDQIKCDLYLSTVPDFDPDSTTIHDSLRISELKDSLNLHTHYWWRVRAYDNWGAERWSDQTWSFYVGFLRGDTNGDEEMSVADVVYLVNYVLKSGNPPVPLESGDVNCDSTVDIVDVVYLIDYLFRNGPPPC